MKRFGLFWLPLLFYCSIIFYFSSKPAVGVGNDKLAHIAEYGILGFLITRAFIASFSFEIKILILLSIVASTLYGISDEFHQSFVPGRDSSGWDVLADLLGSSLGVFLYVSIHRLRRHYSAN